jgi:hypothetical protein
MMLSRVTQTTVNPASRVARRRSGQSGGDRQRLGEADAGAEQRHAEPQHLAPGAR